MSESEFESLALRELNWINEFLDSRSESISIENIDLQDGVLTVEFAKGTFVVNKHGASRQIWYSSPVSPPAYFEPLTDDGNRWWSLRLKTSLRSKLGFDIERLTGNRIKLE